MSIVSVIARVGSHNASFTALSALQYSSLDFATMCGVYETFDMPAIPTAWMTAESASPSLEYDSRSQSW